MFFANKSILKKSTVLKIKKGATGVQKKKKKKVKKRNVTHSKAHKRYSILYLDTFKARVFDGNKKRCLGFHVCGIYFRPTL